MLDIRQEINYDFYTRVMHIIKFMFALKAASTFITVSLVHSNNFRALGVCYKVTETIEEIYEDGGGGRRGGGIEGVIPRLSI